MRLKIILTAVFFIVLSAAVFGQQTKPKPKPLKKQNFSGTWTLDTKKTKLNENSLVKGISMKVLQTAENLKIKTQTDYYIFAENKSGQSRDNGGFGKPPAQTDFVINYTLDGKESEYQESGGIGSAKITAVIEKNGQINLTQTRRFKMTTGEKVLKTYEIWMLSADGKTLNIWRSDDKLKGDFMEKTIVAEITEMVFTKK